MLSPAPKAAVAVAADARPAGASRLPVETWAAIGLTLLAAVLRFATISSQSFWFDEAQLAHNVRLGFGGLMSTIGSQETSPPLYFVLAWLWAKAFGTSEAGLRSLSALAGVAVVPLTYLAGRELVSRWAGLLAAALAALCPFMIWYSQEAREYMLLAATSAGSLLFFARALRRPSSGNLAWWAVLSALALLTHFFAGFLVGPEALWLLARWRSRAAAVAVAAVVAVELALVPLALSDTGHPIGWLSAFPLATRIRQVPVSFAFGTLYRSSLVSDALLGAAILAGVVIFLLAVAAEREQLRGAGIAAALAGAVILVPLLFSLAGHDFYIARALIPGWIPLAIVLAAACTLRRARIPGALLGLVLLASFVVAQIRIEQHPEYQRPDWRGVAAALGRAPGTRAIVLDEGSLATDPLMLYLPRIPWGGPGPGPVRVREVDVVGSTWQAPARPLPAGTALISSRDVDGYRVARFSLARPWVLAPAAIAARAGSLLGPPTPGPAVLVQPAA